MSLKGDTNQSIVTPKILKIFQTIMDIEKIFHMTGGIGETSYSRNSSLQKNASDKVKHITLETIEQVYQATTPKSIGIADMGCSSGPNTLSTIKEIVDAVEVTSRKMLQSPPEFRVYLNDLPTNDFNAIFQALPEFYGDLKKGRSHEVPSVYVAGYPGTFYGRVFPNDCLHFVYASYSLHWLSRLPPGLYDEKGRSMNEGSIYISERSPPQAAQAYLTQFQEDFSLFLRSRSEELITGGRMTMILLGRDGPNHVDRGNSFFWKILFRSLATLVDKGVVEEGKLDSYDVHFYAPSKEELGDMIRRERSLKLERLEMFEMEKDAGDFTSYGARVAMTVRAIQESMIAHHFGEEILDDLFEIYGRLVDEEMARDDIRAISHVVVLRKL